VADAISVYDLIPAKEPEKPKAAKGIPVAGLVAKAAAPQPSSSQGPLARFGTQAADITKTAAKAFYDDPEAATLAAAHAAYKGGVGLINTAMSGVAALAKSMITPVKIDPRASPQDQARQNLDQSLQSFTANQKRIQAALDGVNQAPASSQDRAMNDLLGLIPGASQAIGDSVFERTGSALAATGALSLGTLLSLSPGVADSSLGKVREVAKGPKPASTVSAAFDELAAKHPQTAEALSEHVEQVNPQTAKYMKRRIQKFVDASDEELSIIGKNAAKAAIKDLEAPSMKDIVAKGTIKSPVPTTDGFTEWFKGSKVVDPTGKPLKLYRGMVGGPEGVTESALKGEPRSGYATFMTPNPDVANTYAMPEKESMYGHETGVVAPMYVKANRLIEFPVKTREYSDGTKYTYFDKIAFDERAKRLKPGEALVVRGVVDAGPRNTSTIDPGRKWSYPHDVYAIGKGTETRSSVSQGPALTAEQVGSTLRTAAKEGLEAMARTDMSLSKEERALERERVAALRDKAEGIQREPEPETIPRRAAEHEGVIARRKAEEPLAPEPGSPDSPIYLAAGIPITRRMVERAFEMGTSAAEKLPGFQIARSKMEALYTSFIDTFNPEAKGPAARAAGAAIARNFFSLAQREHLTWEAGKQRRVYWQKMGTKASMEFIDAMESGRPLANPVWEKARQGYKTWASDLVAQDQRTYAGSGKELPYEPRENYVPHLFQDSEGVIRWAQKKFGNKWADPRFIKDRTFNLYQEAIEAGFTPKFTNPEEIMQARQYASDITQLRTELLSDLAAKDLAIVAAKGADRPPAGFSPNSRRSPTGVRYWVRDELDPLMYNAFDSASLWNLQGSSLKSATSSAFRGWMGAKNALLPIKLGFSLFHPMHVLHIDASATLAREAKGMLGKPSAESVKSFMLNSATAYLQPLWTNPRAGYPLLQVFQGRRAFGTLSDADKAAFRDLAEGGMVPTRPQEETSGQIQKFKDALAKRSAAVIWHLPWAGMAAASHPLFGVWIPTLKIASYLKDVKTARELNPNWTDTQRQVALRSIARKVEARYGEMNYNSLFMDKMAKDLGVAGTLSLGWNIGLLDQYVGGAIDLGKGAKRIGLDLLDPESKGKEFQRQLAAGTLDRPVFMTYYVTSALMIGGLMHYGFTGKVPAQLIDYTHPESGEKDQYGKPIRLNTMFYTREFEGLAKHIEQEGTQAGLADFIKNKGSGIMEMARTGLTGVDSLGNDIRNPEDPAYKQVEQTLVNTLTGLDPISVEAIQRSTGGKAKSVGLSVLGFTPAGHYISETVTEGKVADRYNRYVRPKEKPFQAVEMAKDMKTLREMYNSDDPRYEAKLESAAKAYDMTDKDVHRIEKLFASPKEQDFDPSIYMFQKLPWEEQKPLLDQMSAAEREAYLPHISKAKRQKYERETEVAE
jgi:hypothetical protein